MTTSLMRGKRVTASARYEQYASRLAASSGGSPWFSAARTMRWFGAPATTRPSAAASLGVSVRSLCVHVSATRIARRPRSFAAETIGAVFHSNASSDTPTNMPGAASLARGETSKTTDASTTNADHLIPTWTVAAARETCGRELVTGS